MTNATMIQLLSKGDPGADAFETSRAHLESQDAPTPKAPAPDAERSESGHATSTETEAPEQATVVPAFLAKTLCFALPLLRKLVKVSGQVSDAIDILIAFVCSQA